MNSLRMIVIAVILGCSLSSVLCDSPRQLTPTTMKSLQKLIEKYRQVTVSKVLTLNLSNAILLLLLKLTFIGAMYFRNVHKHSYRLDDDFGRYGRSDKSQFSEIDWLDGFLRSVDNGDYNCVYKLACDDLEKTKDYLALTQRILKIYKSTRRYLPYNRKYEDTANAIRDAIMSNKMKCSHSYTCKKRN